MVQPCIISAWSEAVMQTAGMGVSDICGGQPVHDCQRHLCRHVLGDCGESHNAPCQRQDRLCRLFPISQRMSSFALKSFLVTTLHMTISVICAVGIWVFMVSQNPLPLSAKKGNTHTCQICQRMSSITGIVVPHPCNGRPQHSQLVLPFCTCTSLMCLHVKPLSWDNHSHVESTAFSCMIFRIDGMTLWPSEKYLACRYCMTSIQMTCWETSAT